MSNPRCDQVEAHDRFQDVPSDIVSETLLLTAAGSLTLGLTETSNRDE